MGGVFFAWLALLATIPADLSGGRFSVGCYEAKLRVDPSFIMPTVTLGDRTISFAYRTDGRLLDDRTRIDYHSDLTNEFAVLRRTEKGVRADYVHSLYARENGVKRPLGFCSNEVVFAEGRVDVRVTLLPAEPGRYRFFNRKKASQVVVFHDNPRRWVGTTLQLTVSKELSYVNEFTPHERYDPKAWGLNLHETEPAREMVFGNVPDVFTFTGGEGARFGICRYPGGIEASAWLLNDDLMHQPSWDGPVTFSYQIKLEK